MDINTMAQWIYGIVLLFVILNLLSYTKKLYEAISNLRDATQNFADITREQNRIMKEHGDIINKYIIMAREIQDFEKEFMKVQLK